VERGENVARNGPIRSVVRPAAAAARMLGWEPAELVGKPAHELLHHTRDDGRPYAREDCPIHGPAGTERAVESATDDRFWHRDGAGFPVHYRSTPVGQGGAGGTVVVFSDVSERMGMEAALRGASERAARERVQAAEAERARWARELHDETLQGLAGLHVLLSSEIWPADAEGMRERIRVVQDEIENEMEKLRGLIAELRPAALDELGLADFVARLAELYRDFEAALGASRKYLGPALRRHVTHALMNVVESLIVLMIGAIVILAMMSVVGAVVVGAITGGAGAAIGAELGFEAGGDFAVAADRDEVDAVEGAAVA